MPRPRKQAKRTARGRTMRARKNPGVSGEKVTVTLARVGGYVHEMKYEDQDDGENYVHKFGDLQAQMILATHPVFGNCFIVVSVDENPLWRDA